MQHERFPWIPHFELILGCTTPFIYPCVRFRVPPILLLVYLFHLRICESLSTLLNLDNILHQIFVPLSSPSSTLSLTCVGARKTDKIWYQLCYFLVHIGVIIDPLSTSVKVHLVFVLLFLPLTLFSWRDGYARHFISGLRQQRWREQLHHQCVNLRSTTTNARRTIKTARAHREPLHRHSSLRSEEKGLHRQQAFRTKGGARCKDGGDSGIYEVYFPFVIFKAAASTSILFGAPKRHKCKSSTSTTPWRPPSHSRSISS